MEPPDPRCRLQAPDDARSPGLLGTLNTTDLAPYGETINADSLESLETHANSARLVLTHINRSLFHSRSRLIHSLTTSLSSIHYKSKNGAADSVPLNNNTI